MIWLVLRRDFGCPMQNRPKKAEWPVRMLSEKADGRRWSSGLGKYLWKWWEKASFLSKSETWQARWCWDLSFTLPVGFLHLAYGPGVWFTQTASLLASLGFGPVRGFCRRSEGRMSMRSEYCPPSIFPSSSATTGWLDCLPEATALPCCCPLRIPGNFALPSLLPSHLGVMQAPTVASSRVHQYPFIELPEPCPQLYK